jgi:peptidoglycan/LPS O-acetylase OafA/YrhL
VAPIQISLSPILQLVTSPLTAEFMMGAAVGLVWRERNMPGAIIAGVTGFAALALSIIYLAPTLTLITSQHFNVVRVGMFGVPSALIVYALSAVAHRPASIRVRKLLVALGDFSYATYLVHVLVISAVGRALALLWAAGGSSASLVLIFVGFVSANIGGAAVHLIFERPTLKWLHRVG